jgi:HPt (histidine-containing phosphotransfer) domain-containing protein
VIELSSGHIDHVAAPPLAPDDQPIDRDHLSRMTLGERALERELLQLFDHQAAMLLQRMRELPVANANIAASAHTLKGSARGIGAWAVARAAEMVELSASAGGGNVDPALDALATSVAEARGAIVDLLRAR